MMEKFTEYQDMYLILPFVNNEETNHNKVYDIGSHENESCGNTFQVV